METYKKIQVVKGIVEQYVNDNISSVQGVVTVEDINHIVNIGTSILCTKWNIGILGGGFVEAVVNNNLSQAVSRADGTNIKALRLYCQMMYNTSLPSELYDTSNVH